MQQSEGLSRNSNENALSSSSLRLTTPQKSIRRLGLCSQIATGGQHSSPIVFPEKRSKAKSSSRRGSEINSSISKFTMTSSADRDKPKKFEHRIDIGGDEKSDLLGYTVLSGKLILDKRKNSDKNVSDDTGVADRESFDAKLTSTALIWGSHMLLLEDVVSVSFSLRLSKTQGP